MGKLDNIKEWLSGCPALSNLWKISAEEIGGANVILPYSTSTRRTISDDLDITGAYDIEIKPLPSVYEEYQINCFRAFAENEEDFNALTYEEVQQICDWIMSKDDTLDFPEIPGRTVVAVEPFPFAPQIRGVNPDTGLVCYYITLRITYINTISKERSGYYPNAE